MIDRFDFLSHTVPLLVGFKQTRVYYTYIMQCGHAVNDALMLYNYCAQYSPTVKFRMTKLPLPDPGLGFKGVKVAPALLYMDAAPCGQM